MRQRVGGVAKALLTFAMELAYNLILLRDKLLTCYSY